MQFFTFKFLFICFLTTWSVFDLIRGEYNDDKYGNVEEYIESDYSYDDEDYYNSYDDKETDNNDENEENTDIQTINQPEYSNKHNTGKQEEKTPKNQHPAVKTSVEMILEASFSNQNLSLKQDKNKLSPSQDSLTSMPGCKSAGLCCQGKDNNCLTKGARMNGRDNNTCYCDSTCMPLKDCCTDYASHCREVSCVLGQWAEWSDCNVPCGFGVRHRERGVIQDPRNGSPACDVTTQKQVCEGMSCKRTRGAGASGEELRETARILSLKYGHWREAYKYDPLKDIRRNIYHHLGHDSSKRSQLTYCGVYRLEYVQPSCRNSAIFSNTPSPLPTLSHESKFKLDKGFRVCVECQHTAISEELGGRCYGHGVEGKITKWTSLEKGRCRGTWVLEERNSQCSCRHQNPSVPAYIFI